MKQLVYNSVTCQECNETIVSYDRHDYKICSCPNEAMVDGGTDYLRYGAKNMSKIKIFAVYDDDDFELVRQYATRGSRGKDGDQPLSWIAIRDMDDDYLEAVLDVLDFDGSTGSPDADSENSIFDPALTHCGPHLDDPTPPWIGGAALSWSAPMDSEAAVAQRFQDAMFRSSHQPQPRR